jgi:hypothetical protein
MMSFIYILHFERPLCHAQHYTGATTNLIRRTARHQKGHGAAITAAVVAEGIAMHIGGIYMVTDGNLFDAEKRAKARKNGRTMCQICNPKGTVRLPGMRAIDRELFTIPTTKDEG